MQRVSVLRSFQYYKGDGKRFFIADGNVLLTVFETAAIPRNDMGKILRKELVDAARDTVKRLNAVDSIW